MIEAVAIVVLLFDINLQRISLGALIIALGMLVDNGIVGAEGIVIKSSLGLSRKEAARSRLWPKPNGRSLVKP